MPLGLGDEAYCVLLLAAFLWGHRLSAESRCDRVGPVEGEQSVRLDRRSALVRVALSACSCAIASINSPSSSGKRRSDHPASPS